MKKPIKLGIVGLGRAGHGMHLEELAGKEDMFEICAVADLIDERCEEFKEKFGCKVYKSIEELVDDPEIEVVDIATRSCDHYKHAKTALDAGKTVFLEKPMSETYEQAKKLIELGEADGKRRLFIRHNRRFEAKFMHLNSIINSGILGDVFFIRRSVANFDHRTDWQTISQYGGGQLLNWGPHIVDQALRFCGGDYKKLFSVTRRIAAAGDSEDFIIATFEGINGRTVEIEISGGTALSVPDYIAYGTRGSLISRGDTYEIKYMPSDYNLPSDAANPHTPMGTSFKGGTKIPFITEEKEWDKNFLDHTWRYLYRAIREGEDYPIKSEEALKVMQTISEIKRQNSL